MEEFYDNLYGSNVTIISNDFLDKYLPDTRPEYIKVFLFYLWKGLKEGYTISDTSSEIDLEEKDVEMALKYWIKKKIFKKECLIKERIDNTENLVDFQTKKKELINKNRKDYNEIEQNLLFVAEKLLGQTLSERQENLIAKCYNDYQFDEALIHYLFEYCSSGSKRDVRYMSKVADSWYEQGIRTADAARKLAENFEKNEKKRKASAKNNVRANVISRNEYNQLLMEDMLKGKMK